MIRKRKKNNSKMSDSRTTKMDLLEVPANKVYKILPMDATIFAPNPDRYDDDEVGLGYQRTLVNILINFFFCFHFICAALSWFYFPILRWNLYTLVTMTSKCRVSHFQCKKKMFIRLFILIQCCTHSE